MPKIAWNVVLASVIAGIVVVLFQKYAFKNEIITPAEGGPNRVETKFFFQD